MSMGPQRPPYRPQLPAFQAQWDDQRMCWSLFESPSSGNGRRDKWIFSVDEPQHSETHCSGCERKILEHDLRLGYPVADKFSSGGVRTVYVHAHCLPEDVFEGCPAVSELCGQKSTRHLVVWLGKHVHGFNSLKDERQINLAVGFRESLSCNAELIPAPQEPPLVIAATVQQPASTPQAPAEKTPAPKTSVKKAPAQKAVARQPSPAPVSPASPDTPVEAPVLIGKVTKQQLDGLGISALRKYCRQLGLVGTGRRYLLVRRVLDKQQGEEDQTTSSSDGEDEEADERRTAPIAVPKAGKCRPSKRARPAEQSPKAGGRKQKKINEPRKGSASTTASTASTGQGEQNRDGGDDLSLPTSPRAIRRSKSHRQTNSSSSNCSRRLRKWSEKTHSKARPSGAKSNGGVGRGQTGRRPTRPREPQVATRKHQAPRRYVSPIPESDESEEEEDRLRTSSSSGPSCSSPVSILPEGLDRTSRGDTVRRSGEVEVSNSHTVGKPVVVATPPAGIVKTEEVVKREWPGRRRSPLHIAIKREEASPTLKAEEQPSTVPPGVVLSPSPTLEQEGENRTLGSPTEAGDTQQSEFAGTDRATEGASTVTAEMVRSPSPELGDEELQDGGLAMNSYSDGSPLASAVGAHHVGEEGFARTAEKKWQGPPREDCDDEEEFQVWGDGHAEEEDTNEVTVPEREAANADEQPTGVLPLGAEENWRLEGSDSMELLEWGSDSILNNKDAGGHEANEDTSGPVASTAEALDGEGAQEEAVRGGTDHPAAEWPEHGDLRTGGKFDTGLPDDGPRRQSEAPSSRHRSHSRRASSRHGSQHRRGRSSSARRHSTSSTGRRSSHCSSSHRHSSSHCSYSAGDSPNRHSRRHKKRRRKEHRTVLLSRDQVSAKPQLSVSPKAAERQAASGVGGETKDVAEKPSGVVLNPREASAGEPATPKGECTLRPAESPAAVVTEVTTRSTGCLQSRVSEQNASNVTTRAVGWDQTRNNEPTWSLTRGSYSAAGRSYRATFAGQNTSGGEWSGGYSSSGGYYPYGYNGPPSYTSPPPTTIRNFEAYASTYPTTPGSHWSRQPSPPPPLPADQEGIPSSPSSTPARDAIPIHHYYGPGRPALLLCSVSGVQSWLAGHVVGFWSLTQKKKAVLAQGFCETQPAAVSMSPKRTPVEAEGEKHGALSHADIIDSQESLHMGIDPLCVDGYVSPSALIPLDAIDKDEMREASLGMPDVMNCDTTDTPVKDKVIGSKGRVRGADLTGVKEKEIVVVKATVDLIGVPRGISDVTV
ncbi:hypothetical protein FOL47_005596 [Perkinsus chesapeaki]|uniref:SAP domain-containing protein n=1 Tax=Perkinsus chesapeaki TaxID=330153 RepID=A0A7J6LWI8_PERCH|nr:hypothetical protein FOL47_005596 [Perkinsus chesapeaki]